MILALFPLTPLSEIVLIMEKTVNKSVQNNCGMALKEWAVVVQALLKGQQILLLRKGGIAEEKGQFSIKEKAFWLYPTWEHQSAESIQEKYHYLLSVKQVSQEKDPPLSVSAWSEITNVIQINEKSILKEIKPHTIWTDSYLNKRYEYKQEKPLYALFLRMYKRQNPHQIEEKPEYAGCKSWVPLNPPLSTDNLAPVLTDEAYQIQQNKILSLIQHPSA